MLLSEEIEKKYLIFSNQYVNKSRIQSITKSQRTMHTPKWYVFNESKEEYLITVVYDNLTLNQIYNTQKERDAHFLILLSNLHISP